MASKLKFDVVLLEADSNLTEISQWVNSCDVMMGVRGAGLTNLVFLPNNAVFIQVLPLGGLEWLATTDFGDPRELKDPYNLIQKRGWSDLRQACISCVCLSSHFLGKAMYNSIVAGSFSQHWQKKMRRGAFFGGLVLGFFICIYFTPYQGPLPFGADVTTRVKSRIVCHFTEPESDFCEMHGDIRILGNSSTIFIPHFRVADMFTKNNSSGIKPYARKTDGIALEHVRQFRFSQEMPRCTQNHRVPAILFSIGGYTGNYFHSFTDVVIPLYTTSRKFNGEVQFLLADKNGSWTTKFQVVLKKLSNYEAIDIDKQDGVHCFPSMIIGLKKYKELSIDPLTSPDYSMTNFREFLRSSYYLKREYAIRLGSKEKRRPRLLIISRKRTRTLLNEHELVTMGQNLGFDVVLAEARSNISEVSKLVNSCDVLMGVHGAGLTNIVFLPKNAVFIQVLPIPSGDFEWIARTSFGDPSKTMNLREFLRSSYYLKREYAIRLGSKEKKRPRLLIISRKRTRTLMNEHELVTMAQKLGFDVVLAEASSNISEFSQLVNSCDVLMGVHGAGLTNIVFLPKNALFIQVLPIPFGDIEWIARTTFGDPSKTMNLRYLEYKISGKESSLIQKYPLDHEVFKNPNLVAQKGWSYFKSMYLENQNVKLDVLRFKTTLLEALQMLSM
ncbi:hypothetical protein ACET3Z_014258 [Daucus carota]